MTRIAKHLLLTIQVDDDRTERIVSPPSSTLASRRNIDPNRLPMLKRPSEASTVADEEDMFPVRDAVRTRNNPSHKIVEGIYVGNSKSGDDVFMSNPDDISLVINLFGRKTYEEAQLQNNSQVELMNISVQDEGNKSEEFLKTCSGKESFDRNNPKTWFKAAFDKIDRCLNSNGRVLVHCHEGISRSVTLTTAYLMKREGWSFNEAIATVRRGRDKADPNLGFVMLLQEYEDMLKAERKNEAKEANDLQYQSFLGRSNRRKHRLENTLVLPLIKV